MRQYKNSYQLSVISYQLPVLYFLLITVHCSLFTAPSLAEDKTPANTDQPITITSNNMEARKKENLVIFRGDVVAQQKDYTLYSRELHVYYADGQEIKEMIATGDVRIVQSDKVATGEKAVYTKVNRAVVLTGNPQVEQGCDVVKGEKIIMYLDEDKSVVEGSSDNRVKVIMHPKDEKTKAKCR